jgi:hypothetical protein
LVDLHVLESLDPLRDSVFEHLEIVGGQILNGPSVGRGVRVHPNEVRIDAKWLRRTRLCWTGLPWTRLCRSGLALVGFSRQHPGRKTEY